MVCQQPDRYIGSSILMVYFRCVSVSAYLPWKPFCRYLRKIYDYKKFRVKFETVKLLSCKISYIRYTSLWSVFNQHICGSLCVSRFEYQFQNILLHNIGIRIGEALTMCPECSHVRSSSLKCQIYTSHVSFLFFFFDMFLQSQTQVSSVSAGKCLGMMTSFAASWNFKILSTNN